MSKIEESLASAKIVQRGLLPKQRHLKRVLRNYFVFYEPRDIISGDFYWVGEKHGMSYLVVGDCTGHGVSASLLSVLGLNLFEYVIMNKGIKKVSKILQEVDKKFIESFSETNSFDNPWIDLSIVCIDRRHNKIHFSSANRKILVVPPAINAVVLKGSRYPIGGWQIEDDRVFTSRVIPYKVGTTIYLGSDGFQDQIGGIKNKKFKSKQLHQLLVDISQQPLNEQKDEIANQFNNWKGRSQQTDDVCLLGVRL